MRPLRRAQDFEGRELQALQQLKVRQMGDSIDAVAEDCIPRLSKLNDESVLLVAKLIHNPKERATYIAREQCPGNVVGFKIVEQAQSQPNCG